LNSIELVGKQNDLRFRSLESRG